MSESADLYERDFVAWTEEQAARIRAAAATHGNPSRGENRRGGIQSAP